MKVTAVRRIQFCSGHRVMGHENKCRNLHGHNYVALFHAEGEELDNIGRVIDFSVLKTLLVGWIDKYWDHAFIVFAKDTEVLNAITQMEQSAIFIMPTNPTAENMAKYLLEEVCPVLLFEYGIRVTKIELWETENCKAEVCFT